MRKHLRLLGAATLACAAIAVIPAAASAAGLYANGTLVPAGTQVAGYTTGPVDIYAGTNAHWQCTGSQISGTVNSNSASTAVVYLAGGYMYGPAAGDACNLNTFGFTTA